ncbi:MAG: hypothetical protein HKO86_01260 [Gammaproteobacteria bacterium]|nr:hypothetical protein [Gammaproteobacteria bacterium]
MNETANNNTAAAGTAKLVYILYLVSLLIGITAIVGLIIAYVNRDDAPGWLQSHYQFQIRTFWIGAFYMIVGILLLQFLIGLLILLFFIFWLIVRCARGIKYLDKKEAYPEPGSWMF